MAGSKLTARGAATTRPGRYGDGAGLWLVVSKAGARKWTYRFSWGGKVTEMGLGSADVVGLAEARALRDEARKVLASRRNPIEARREERRPSPTFGMMADEVLEAKRSEWRNDKHAKQWAWSLNVACAALRPKPVDAIDTADILAVLKPLWTKTPATAGRVRQRIEIVLNAAKAKNHRTGENPAAWRGHLEHLLPRRQKVEKAHLAAMSYHDVPSFLERLRAEESMAARALEFCVLTASRAGNVYAARWCDIELAAKLWTIPANHMKSGREHRVPLSNRAVEILENLAAARTGQFVFPSPFGDKPFAPVAMQKTLRRLVDGNATVHGFRSSFRDWAGHETSFPREVAEQALAHRLGDAAELAYKRGDFLEKRRAMMEDWAAYCESSSGGNVVVFKRSGAST